MKTDVLFGAILAAILVVSPALSQEAAQEGSNSSSESQQASESQQQEEAPAASQPSGGGRRRDPFRAIVVETAADDDVPVTYPPGKPGLVIGQLQVQGIAHSIDGTWIAVVDNNTGRAYFLRENDKLYNGVVSKINPDSVVFIEETTDSSGQQTSREVVKELPEN